MSSCLSGGSRAYGIDPDIIKSPTATSWASNSSSTSSILSESRNSPLSISTRKARALRKRPNQTYNEAAAILSTAYPKIFPPKHLTNPCKFTKPYHRRSTFSFEASDLLMVVPLHAIDDSGSLLERPNFPIEPRLNPFEKPCPSPGEISSQGNSSEIYDEYQEDFDAESILDEVIEGGIDSIMGNLSMESDASSSCSNLQVKSCGYGHPVGLGFDFGHGIRRESRATRDRDKENWWTFPRVNVADLTQKIAEIPVGRKEKKLEKKIPESATANSFLATRPTKENATNTEESVRRPNAGLFLKLNYDDVLKAWADKGSPFAGDALAADSARNNVQGRFAQMDLSWEKATVRGVIAVPYKGEKRNGTRVVSKRKNHIVQVVTKKSFGDDVAAKVCEKAKPGSRLAS